MLRHIVLSSILKASGPSRRARHNFACFNDRRNVLKKIIRKASCIIPWFFMDIVGQE